MKEILGRVLGPSKNEGNEMAQNVLSHKGIVLPWRSVRKLTQREIEMDSEKKKRSTFDELIVKSLGNSMILPANAVNPQDVGEFDYDERNDDSGEPAGWSDSDPVDEEGVPTLEHSLGDTLVNAEVLMPQGDNRVKCKVKQRHVEDNGHVTGQFNENPLLNSIIYDVEFPDGSVREYGANIIAQNMYSTLDEHGHLQQIMDGILDHSKDDTAVCMEDKYLTTKSGQRRLRMSTRGWKILVRWKDESEEWIPLRILKESYPCQLATYAVANNLVEEPAFAWWVLYTLQKSDTILSAVKSRNRNMSVKYGIKRPSTIEQAHAFDIENNNTLWQDAISLEMGTILPAFDFLKDNKAPAGYTKSSGHIVFDIKMDFTCKARWVKDGHLTRDPIESNYAGVVSRESVRIALTYAALNDLNVAAGDIKSAYLQAPTSEKHYIICGKEFPLELQGRVAIIRRALYGGKSAGSDYWKHMCTCMEYLKFKSCKADPDVWMRPVVKASDGTEYWEYVLLYVDDALSISMNAEDVLNKEIGKYWTMKKDSVGPPDIYLGNKISKVTLENGVSAWAFSLSQYVQSAVKNVEAHLSKSGGKLPTRAATPFSSGYRPEIDVSEELLPTNAAYYQSLIGILCWIVKLGRMDMTCEVSMMASMMALPCKGHLQELYHMFAYLKHHHNAELVLDPTV